FLHARYNFVCPTDWDEDGLVDLFYVSMERDEIHHFTMPENADLFQSSNYFTFLKNTGRRDISGLPILKETKHYSALAVTHNAYAPAVAVEDLDGDGKKDIIGVKSHSGTHETPIGQVGIATVFFYRNIGVDKNGLPDVADPVELKTTEGETIFGYHYSPEISFGDINNDGRIDIIFNNTYVRPRQVLWHENKGGSPPVFLPARQIKGLPDDRRGYRWARWKDGEGLLAIENQDFLVRTIKNNEPVFTSAGGLREISGPLVQGHQEKPEWIDWDNDSDMDLLAGEAFGRIHLYENTGSQKYPQFKSPVWIKADGKILKVDRYTVFGEGPHLHPMGYLSVACVDWDRDGLFDLIAPNETNRVYWFENIGTLDIPKFDKREQILPDGFTDSQEKLNRSHEISNDPKKSNNGVYPYFDDEPFFWRTRLAIADYTGDELEDIIALNGLKNLVLYERYRDSSGKLKLKSGKQLYYANGDAIEKPHYFKMRNVDWNKDGLMDIVVTQNLFSRDQRSLLLLKNVGTKEMPVFERPKAFQMWNKVISYSSHGLQPSFVDWDGDGSLDFVGCSESGFFVLFRNAVLSHSKPKVVVGVPKK
ncbi:MAG: VCBS repeat-containing protein, partial [Bacteroidota bacterium]|nr:VCBS repeat-containing protein [Bacteroidota bacterium]